MSKHYDAIIIGTGQAGPALAEKLNGANMRVAIIERGLVGGTCVNVGCIPTKTLVASARAAYTARRAADFGVSIDGSISVDMTRVHGRMKEISGQSNIGVTTWIEGMDGVDFIRGHARLEGERSVRVNDEVLTSERIFLNVGGRALVPPMPGLDEVDYFTNSTMMDIDFLPRHLIIIGGSYIGLEFAQMYRRFGSEVTIIELGPRLIHREDEDVSARIQQILEDEGIHIRLDAECMAVEKQGDSIAVRANCKAGEPEIVGSHLLLAVGRIPNTDDLGLDRAGVKTDSRGFISVNEQLETNVPGIFALGDCNGQGAFTHTSYNDFEIAAANLLDDDPRRLSDRIQCYGLFIDPPLGRVGMTTRQAVDSGRNVLVGQREMTRVGRAREFGETKGFMKILVDADTKEILGASLLGLNCDEVVHGLLDMMYAKAPYTVISRAVHIHPTVAELIPTTLQDLRPLG